MEDHQHGERGGNGEAAEFKNIIARYPKLSFRIIVGLCVIVLSISGWLLKGAYGKFDAVVSDVEVMKQKHIDIDKAASDQREDIREIRSDVKEILRSQRRSSSFAIPERREPGPATAR